MAGIVREDLVTQGAHATATRATGRADLCQAGYDICTLGSGGVRLPLVGGACDRHVHASIIFVRKQVPAKTISIGRRVGDWFAIHRVWIIDLAGHLCFRRIVGAPTMDN